MNNLRFADDIDLMGGSNSELQDLTNRLTQRSGAYGMEVSSEKSKVLKNSANATPVKVFMNGQELEEVSAFRYLGATLRKDSRSTAEIMSRISIVTSTMAKLDKIWRNKGIRFPSKMRL